MHPMLVLLLCALPAALCAATDAPGWQTLAALEFPVGERLPFEETTVSRILKRPVIATGELWLTGDGTLQMAMRDERRALEQQLVTLTRLRSGADRDPDNPADLIERRLPIQSDRPAQVLLRSIAQLMGGDIEALQANFELLAATRAVPADAAAGPAAEVDAAADRAALTGTWELRLEPKAEQLRRRLPLVVLQGVGERLLAIRADRGSQGSQTVRLLSSAAPS